MKEVQIESNQGQDDLLIEQHIRCSFANQRVSVACDRKSMTQDIRAQNCNAFQCLYNQIFSNLDSLCLNEAKPCKTLPFNVKYSRMPKIMKNQMYNRFENNHFILTEIRCDQHCFQYEVMKPAKFCQAPKCYSVYEKTETKTFQRKNKYNVRVLEYFREHVEEKRFSEYEESLMDKRTVQSDLGYTKNRPGSSTIFDVESVLIIHDFHQHPLIFKSFVSYFQKKRVIIPYIHDLLQVAYLVDQNNVMVQATQILLNILSQYPKITVIAHGVGCIIAQQFCNHHEYSQIVMCNPPPNFRYIYDKEVVVKNIHQVMVNQSFTTPSEVMNTKEKEVEVINCNTVEKQFQMSPNGNTSFICGDYNELTQKLCDKISQQATIEDLTDYLSVGNRCMNLVYSSHYYTYKHKKPFMPSYFSHIQLERLLLKLNRRNFKNIIYNLLIFAPLATLDSYIDSGFLFDSDFFDSIQLFVQILHEEMPIIGRDSINKYFLFASNYAFAEEQTMNFFTQMDKLDGQIYSKTVIGCGYDMFQCIPQVLSHFVGPM